ncbi:GGDEF domain-containing protein [Alishewanella longhuensis]|uniref:diguanylate cyclase n=1 Tax=Alishewanella longhuensis TaxID=1091037 RepID=A0ABQ3LAF3_9ALTE|nr:GGDEF domain-containing protein [Alishewanella longhuensis]GHG76364.1 GGDEF domain-containing protein [Alishewanella longhuensis]
MSERLNELDEIRLKDRHGFSQQVSLLKNSVSTTTLTNDQLAHLSLLYAWDKVLSGDFNQALSILEEAAGPDNKQLLLRIQGLKVNIHILSYRYTEAFIGIEQLLKALPSLTNELTYYQVIGQVILLFNNIERYDLAQQLIEQGLKISQASDIRCRLQALGLQGIYKTSDFQHYDASFTDVNSLCEQAEETIFNLLVIRNHMFYLLEQQQYPPVLRLYTDYISQVLNTNYPILNAGFQAAAAEALLKQGDLVAADKLARAAEQSLPTDRHDPAVLASYRVLYLLAQAEGNFNNLLFYGEKRRETELAIAKEKASQQLAYQLATGESRLKEQRIQLLDKDNELLTLERNLYQQQAENRYLFLIIISGFTLLLAVLSYRGLTRSQRFRRLAEFDQLTGISNRHHFYQQANIAAKYCEQNQRPLSVVVFDLDYFKKINDTYGHAMGDWALQQVVACCRNFMRNSDIFGRVGGEEFAIVLPDCTADKAEMLAEICRDAIAAIDTSHFSSPFTLTASFGVSEAAHDGYDISALLDSADKALYKAKDNGRNQVWCSN